MAYQSRLYTTLCLIFFVGCVSVTDKKKTSALALVDDDHPNIAVAERARIEKALIKETS